MGICVSGQRLLKFLNFLHSASGKRRERKTPDVIGSVYIYKTEIFFSRLLLQPALQVYIELPPRSELEDERSIRQ